MAIVVVTPPGATYRLSIMPYCANFLGHGLEWTAFADIREITRTTLVCFVVSIILLKSSVGHTSVFTPSRPKQLWTSTSRAESASDAQFCLCNGSHACRERELVLRNQSESLRRCSYPAPNGENLVSRSPGIIHVLLLSSQPQASNWRSSVTGVVSTVIVATGCRLLRDRSFLTSCYGLSNLNRIFGIGNPSVSYMGTGVAVSRLLKGAANEMPIHLYAPPSKFYLHRLPSNSGTVEDDGDCLEADSDTRHLENLAIVSAEAYTSVVPIQHLRLQRISFTDSISTATKSEDSDAQGFDNGTAYSLGNGSSELNVLLEDNIA
ncbi:hypothetical protein FPV67DRAFT_1447265 [Lyophyllum atratum]|nr:hypothetical protein FPV67DRAFT_1447265 [Lyophyllum atratum]